MASHQTFVEIVEGLDSEPTNGKAMPDPKQLPHLIKLLGDDSDIVQQSVLRELELFGPALDKELLRQNIKTTTHERKLIDNLIHEHSSNWLREQWSSWLAIPDDKLKLESALGMISEFQNGRGYPMKLTPLLNLLAEEFDAHYSRRNARYLADFLFQKKQLRGATPEEYYKPENSNLVQVIEQKRGIPISLASIYILVAHRLELPVEGCNFPGHFLAKATIQKKTFIVDCYDGGKFLSDRDLASLNTPIPLTVVDICRLECNAEIMIARVLRNLVNAYRQVQNEPDAELMASLLESFTQSSEGEEDA
jgi:hypothetical protein